MQKLSDKLRKHKSKWRMIYVTLMITVFFIWWLAEKDSYFLAIAFPIIFFTVLGIARYIEEMGITINHEFNNKEKHICTFTKLVSGKKNDGTIRTVKMESAGKVVLPFKPTIGLSIEQQMNNCVDFAYGETWQIRTGTIQNITWSQEYFKCSTEGLDIEYDDFNEILEKLEFEGWKINKNDVSAKVILRKEDHIT